MTGKLTAQPQPPLAQRIVFMLIAVMAAIVPLESFLITLFARTGFVPDKLLFAGQFAIEATVYLALACVLLVRLINGCAFRRTPADVPLLVILAIVALAVAVNNTPITGSLMNLRSALRYAAVFYLVTQLGLTQRQVGIILWVILISGALQVFAGALQWLVGYDLKVWMLPFTSEIEIAGKSRRFALVERGREIGSLFGTLGDTLYYGLFLVVVLAVIMPRVHWFSTKFGLGLVPLCLGIAYSYSRAAVIVTGLTLVAYASAWWGVRRVAAVCCLLAALGFASIGSSLVMQTHGGVYHHPRQGRRSITANMTNIFSADYLERSKRQRLGTVLGVAPTALMNAPVLGYGPDQMHAVEQLNNADKTRLYKTMTKEGFEDVYWVAILCYTGLAGVLAVGWLIVRLGWTCAYIARSASMHNAPILRWAGLAGLCIVCQAAVLMLFNRVPEIRSFSFYLWLLPALAFAAWMDQRAPQPQDHPEPATHDTMSP